MSRRHVRGLVAATAVLLVLTGCGGGGDGGSEAEPTPAPVTEKSQEELLAALPELADVEKVEDGATVGRTCPTDGPEECGEADDVVLVSRTFDLQARGEPVEIEMAGDTLQFAGMFLIQSLDERSAEELVETRREDDATFDGEFDLPIEDKEYGRSPGRRGEGSITEVTVSDLPAQLMQYEADFNFGDSEVERRHEVHLTLVAGPVVVDVLVNTTVSGRTAESVRELAITLAEDAVEKLRA